MEILSLCGSLRAESVTLKALKIAAEGVESAGGTATILSSEAMDLPLYKDIPEGEPSDPKIIHLREAATKAEGFLLGCPEYHGGYSGVLKNALDWLSGDHFSGKPVALVAVAGGASGAFNTLNSLRICCRWVHAWVLPEQVSIGLSHLAFDEDGRPVDPLQENRLQALGKGLVEASKVLPRLRDPKG